MASVGSSQWVLVCVPRASGNSVSPCSNVGTQSMQPGIVNALLVDNSATGYLQLVVDNPQQPVPWDYSGMAAAFAFGLTLVFSSYILAKPIGLLIGLVRKL